MITPTPRTTILATLFFLGAVATAPAQGITNSIGMRLIEVPAGSFTMGSTNGDYDEKVTNAVTISRDFFMGVHEVTNSQYEQFDPDHADLRGKHGFSTADDEAVIFVSWYDAVNFCKWLSDEDGATYRLATEAEWEYAARAGTTTPFYTGDAFPGSYGKNQLENNLPYWGKDGPGNPGGGIPVSLAVGTGAPSNEFGLRDMHGNVEEWCNDWWGPYDPAAQTDPVGREQGMGLKVTRGGAHNQEFQHLRSANRANAVPSDRSAMIGFRVVKGPTPTTAPLPAIPSLYQRNVIQQPTVPITRGPDPTAPYFVGPRQFVKVRPDGPGDPVLDHDPAITACPNGDILAIWYSGDENEPGLVQMASRLRFGSDAWDEASLFWDTSDRNDHAPALWTDPRNGRIYHFSGISTYAKYSNLAWMLRTSDDNGVTWSLPRMIGPEHGRGGDRLSDHMPTDSNFRMGDGTLVCVCDAGKGSVLHLSNDDGRTWTEPTKAQKILGIHGNALELRDENGNPDGRIMAVSRNAFVLNSSGSRQMPKSVTPDKGQIWTHTPLPFQRATMGQRPTMARLREGPIILASFIGGVRQKRSMDDPWSNSWPGGSVTDAAGLSRSISGLFVAVSYDEGETWPVKRVLSPNSPASVVQCLYGRFFEMDSQHAEFWGYLGSCQGGDGVVHIITSWNEYAFNLKWLESAMPTGGSPVASIKSARTESPRTITLVGSLNQPDADYSYTWYFGDGESETGRDVTHTYAETGHHVVTLIVADNNNGHWETKSETIIVGGTGQR